MDATVRSRAPAPAEAWAAADYPGGRPRPGYFNVSGPVYQVLEPAHVSVWVSRRD